MAVLFSDIALLRVSLQCDMGARVIGHESVGWGEAGRCQFAKTSGARVYHSPRISISGRHVPRCAGSRLYGGPLRARIAKQQELDHYQEVLRNLRQGGCGKQAMAPVMKPMTTCTLDDGTTLTNDEARAASTNYSKLFRPETPATLDATEEDGGLTKRLPDEETDLQTWLQLQWDYWEWPETVISQDDVIEAFGTAKPGRTCGSDGLVSEMWQAAVATRRPRAYQRST